MVIAAGLVMLGFAHGRLIDCDKVEVGYVRLAEVGAAFMFQMVAGMAEKAAVIVTCGRHSGSVFARLGGIAGLGSQT